MRLTVIGCSDAFGSGARLQTCFHLALSDRQVLLDCGATSLIGLQRQGLDPNAISQIFLTHLHGDHFAGLVWWMIHAKHVSARRSPLTVVGPAGTEERYRAASDILFPGTGSMDLPFNLTFETHQDGRQADYDGVAITPVEVLHPSGAPPYALRLEADGKAVSFSGDTEWVEKLVPCAAGADLFIVECFGYENEARYHMNWRTIAAQLDRLTAKRILLTHMGPEMLANRDSLSQPRILLAEDGLAIDL